jgi:lipocalin
MARTPHLTDEAYQALVKKVSDMGYDLQKLRRVPHNKANQ